MFQNHRKSILFFARPSVNFDFVIIYVHYLIYNSVPNALNGKKSSDFHMIKTLIHFTTATVAAAATQ